MGKTAICTISTQSHIFKSKALLQSLRQHSSAHLFCLVIDSVGTLPKAESGETYHSLHVLDSELAHSIKKKYRGNKLRWSCKPLYMMHLLRNGYEKVIYVDNDIYFFSHTDFLFDELDHASIILTPHHYPISASGEQNWLEANFRVGLYNAGFVGASIHGMEALKWWAQCCLYNVKQASWRGLFDDQKYLDLLPIAFDGVKVLKHKGCNVAGWNKNICTRISVHGNVLIDGIWEIVFIHFAPITIRNIVSGNDAELLPHLREYENVIKRYANSPDPIKAELKRTYKDYLLYFRHIRWQITRIFE